MQACRNGVVSILFYSDGSGFYPLRLVLASPSPSRSDIIVSKMVRCEEVMIIIIVLVVIVIIVFVFIFVFLSIVLVAFFVSSSSSVFASQRERRGTVTLWSDVHRDLGWIFVSVYRCRRVWEARRGQRGLVAKVGKRFIRPRELPNYTWSH